MQDRAKIIHQNFLQRVADENLPDSDFLTPEDAGLTDEKFVEIFESQLLSRWLDSVSRELQAKGEGFYTIGSSGHEGNAAVAAALRHDDMAFLHYRDAAFLIQRSKQLEGQTPLWDMLLSFVASSEDPISSGRHKVLGSKTLFIPPQTSTIASHLPKAVGAAYSIGLNRRLGRLGVLPEDGIAFCSFGDASVNHSTSQGAFNTAAWTAYQGVALPLLFLCEDNGIGISTMTPPNWVRRSFENRPSLKYFFCNSLNVLQTYRKVREVREYIRKRKAPAFLHSQCVRLLGHAGADAQQVYLSREKIEEAEANDPLLHTAQLLLANKVLRSDQIIGLYQEIGERVKRAAEHVVKRPKLSTVQEVQSSLIPPRRESLSELTQPDQKAREALFDSDLKMMGHPHHMARLINWALHDLMLKYPNIVMAGEDIGPKGGVYNVTTKLHKRFGASRVINTLLDEQSILGLAIGLAHNNILPIPEIQFLAYLHNAEDQLRGEAATLSFFSNGQYTNPMLIRIAGLSYQKGFGGHFHNDNSIAAIRDIPGVVIACPSNGADAVEMLRESVRLVHEEQRIVVFLEPIALYMVRDLHNEKDGLWTAVYRAPENAEPISLGQVAQHGDGKDLCIITYGNGYYLSRQAAQILEETHGFQVRVIDLRWLAPLKAEAILKAIKPCKHVLIVDECRSTGSISEALMALIHENMQKLPKLTRHAAADCFIPLGRAYNAPLPRKETIIEQALSLLGKKREAS